MSVLSIICLVCAVSKICQASNPIRSSKETYVIRYLEGKRITPVTVELDLEEQTEHVLNRDNGAASETLYDFNQSQVAYKDLNSKQCFVARITSEKLERDRERLKVLQNGIVRGFRLSTFIIHEEIGSSIEILQKLGKRLAEFCNGLIISLVRKDESQLHRKKRQAPAFLGRNGQKGQFTHHSYGHYGQQSNNYAHYGHETHITGTVDQDGNIRDQNVHQHQMRSESSQSLPVQDLVNNLQSRNNDRSGDSSIHRNTFPSRNQQGVRSPVQNGFHHLGRGNDPRGGGQFSLETTHESGYQLNLPLGLRAGNAYTGGIRSRGQYGVGGQKPQISTEFQRYPNGMDSGVYRGTGLRGTSLTLPPGYSGMQPSTEHGSTFQAQKHPGSSASQHRIQGARYDEQGKLITTGTEHQWLQKPSYTGAEQVPHTSRLPDGPAFQVPVTQEQPGASFSRDQISSFVTPEQPSTLMPGLLIQRARDGSIVQGYPPGHQIEGGLGVETLHVRYPPGHFPGGSQQVDTSSATLPQGYVPRARPIGPPGFVPQVTPGLFQQRLTPNILPGVQTIPSTSYFRGTPAISRTHLTLPSGFPVSGSVGGDFRFRSSDGSGLQSGDTLKKPNLGMDSSYPDESRSRTYPPTIASRPGDISSQSYIPKVSPDSIRTIGGPGGTQRIPGSTNFNDTGISSKIYIPSSTRDASISSSPFDERRVTNGHSPVTGITSTRIPSGVQLPSIGGVPTSPIVSTSHLPSVAPHTTETLRDNRGRQINVSIPTNRRMGTVHLDSEDSASSQTQVQSGFEGTAAEASSAGRYRGLGSKSQVQGGYSGNGSFSAQAQSGFTGGVTQSQVQGGKQGGLSGSSAQVEHLGSVQSQVQIGQPSGAASSTAQGRFSSGTTQVQAQSSKTSGSAGAQSQASGLSNSQVQVNIGGETDYRKENGFQGSISASVHGGHSSAQSQTQLQGAYDSGRTYVATAQGGFDSTQQFQGSILQPGSLPSLPVQTSSSDFIPNAQTIDTPFTPGLTSHGERGIPQSGTNGRRYGTEIRGQRGIETARADSIPGFRNFGHLGTSYQPGTLASGDSKLIPASVSTHYIPGSQIHARDSDQVVPQTVGTRTTGSFVPRKDETPGFHLPSPQTGHGIESTPLFVDQTIRPPNTSQTGLLPLAPGMRQVGHRMYQPSHTNIQQPGLLLPSRFSTGVPSQGHQTEFSQYPHQTSYLHPGHRTYTAEPNIPITSQTETKYPLPPMQTSIPTERIATYPSHSTQDSTSRSLYPSPPSHLVQPPISVPLQPGYSSHSIQPIPGSFQPGFASVDLQPEYPSHRVQPSIPSTLYPSHPTLSQTSRPGTLHPEYISQPGLLPSQIAVQPSEEHHGDAQIRYTPGSSPTSRVAPPELRHITTPGQPGAFQTGIQYPPSLLSGQTHISPPSQTDQRLPASSLPTTGELPDHPPRTPGVREPEEKSCCEALQNLKRRCCSKTDSPCCSANRNNADSSFGMHQDFEKNAGQNGCKIVKVICYIVYKPVGKARVCKPTTTINGCR